ncbi:hypothetical protein H702_07200 [Streptococcus equinus JB1]|uniref:Uncharacterized protein n=1 Tax=Streptococcus equinus JB1 TaxID=1294274 RepID=A0A091CAU4_STREI|nr:hypothetical protein [Streptococcus equinus]KFN87438.1 hypothetical protein H702_07200 [Streptococcus equinus JB1]SFL15897.1 hypothetical protein SAMN02910290_00688 [Streptococcus equinus JB1]
MKEFKEIIDGIAHSLNMTVDGLVKAYPHLRTEYSWYYFCENVQLIFTVLLIVYAIVSIVLIGVGHIRAVEDDYSEKSVDTLHTICKLVVLGIAILLGVILVTIGIESFASPDVLIINRVLDTIN